MTETTIEDLCERIIDYRGKTPPKAEQGVKLLTAKVIKGGTIDESRLEYITEDTYRAWMRRGMPQAGDLLLTTEAPLGETAILRTDERIALAQRVILLRANPLIADQHYLFAALRSPTVQARLQARATGTTVLGIKQSELRRIEVPLPPLAVQKKIGAVVTMYDDLIENNARRIQILEEMAQAIYREWFVEFRFPGHESMPLVDSDLGPIPKGWQPGVLGDLVEEMRRGIDPASVPCDTPYIGLEHMPEHSIAISSWGEASDAGSRKYQYEAGEILFGKIRPYFHKVGVPPVLGICSTDAIVIRPRDISVAGFSLAVVSSEAFVLQAVQTSNGTKMPRANWSVLEKYSVVVPPSPLLEVFEAHMKATISQIHTLIMANRNLRATRDILLPRLISGEVELPDLHIDTSESAR